MSKKLTWDAVYQDFKKVYPNFSKTAVHYEPYGYATILIYLDDGKKGTYDYMMHKFTFLSKGK